MESVNKWVQEKITEYTKIASPQLNFVYSSIFFRLYCTMFCQGHVQNWKQIHNTLAK